MDAWHTAFLGIRQPPRELSAFELQAFFTFDGPERAAIDQRRSPALRLGLALHIGFLRMSGRSLDGFRVVPSPLWRHLGAVLNSEVPELASLRALYRRRSTLFEHQQLACELLGFRAMREHQRRYLVRILGDELWRQSDRDRLMVFVRRWLYEHRLLIPGDRAVRSLVNAAAADFESQLRTRIRDQVDGADLEDWCARMSAFLHPLLERVRAGVESVEAATRAGVLQVDDDLHLAALKAEEEAPEVQNLRTRLDRRIGDAQLPDLFLEIDAQVRFSWIMLGREPRSADELLMVYAGILAQGTALTAAETARMIPPLSPTSVRQAMRWVGDERRLADANGAVLSFMQRQPIAATWGRDDLASSDMMSLETSKRVWQARNDPRRKTPSLGIYSHVSQRWGVFYAQPVVLNERQAGPAIEGVVRQEQVDPAQLAVDTHGYTDFAMTLARLLGFDLCPRLKSLRERRLFVPQGWRVPDILRPVCSTSVDLDRIPEHWDALVNLAASVHSGNASAVAVMARFGSCAKGDPIYEAGVQIGRLLRTVFLADFFVNADFRREILRVLNRGEAVNSLKRLIYAGRVANVQARRGEEMQAVAEALNLLANIVMAWNTAQMQAALDRWANRRQVVPPELIGRIAPTHVEGINLRGIFRFPIDRFAPQLLPSHTEPKLRASG